MRIHRADRAPWWYSNDGDGRFDLCGFGVQGTCYLAEDELGSFVETFRDTALVSQGLIDTKSVSTMKLRRALRLADCCSGLAREFGVTAGIHSSEDYAATQAWAAALAAAGFDGVRYFVSHDPRQRLVGVALFGQTNEDPDEPRAISPDVIAAAESIFGLRVRPTR